MALNYRTMLARFVKVNADPATWDLAGIPVWAKFNKWRKSARMRAMTEEIFRPVMAGPNWDPQEAPYSWMYTPYARNRALLITTAAERPSPSSVVLPIRWLSPTKRAFSSAQPPPWS